MQQQTGGVEVEPPDRRDERPDVRDQVVDRRPSLRILVRRHIAGRLVEQQIDAFARDERLAVEVHAIAGDVHAAIGIRA